MANQFKLSELFKAIHGAVDEAADVSREATNRWIQNFFDVDGNTLTPKYVTVILPIMENGSFVNKPTQIPLFSLANHQTLNMETLKISFEVNFHNCDEGHAMVSSCSSWFSSSTKAKVEMTFKGEKPSEGVMRINDVLVKTIPT